KWILLRDRLQHLFGGHDLTLHPAAARVGGGQRIVGISDALERADLRALHGVDRLAIHEQRRVADHHRGAGLLELRVAAHVDLGAHASLLRADLPRQLHLAAAERAARAEPARPRTIEAEQLPHSIDAEAARLHRIAEEVALEEPVVDANVAFADDPPARAASLDRHDPVEHQ